MLTNLLTSALPEGGKYVSIGEASLEALIGFLVVIAGISFLIFIVWLVGKLMVKAKRESVTENKTVVPQVEEKNMSTTSEAEEVDEETVAVIMAALMSYYQTNNPKCTFTLKRIKRIKE